MLGSLSEVGRWAAMAHVLDYDDLHLESTAHLSAVCLPVALACEGGARAYLVGAGVMARLGEVLGWPHYAAGWHATCTAGAPAAAAGAAAARGLDADGIAVAMALAVPAAGGIQRAFGTSAKSLQVAFAAEAGMRAAALAADGADADPSTLDTWVELVGGDAARLPGVPDAVPGGLAVKPYPCCYALQRPIAAVRAIGPLDSERVRRIAVRTPASSLAPLIHDRPVTGPEGKFSLQYGLACALLDDPPDLESFGDEAVTRPTARRLMELVEIEPTGDGDGLLAGEVAVAVTMDDGTTGNSELELPPGAPRRPLSDVELQRKVKICSGELADQVSGLGWETAADFLRYWGAVPEAIGDRGTDLRGDAVLGARQLALPPADVMPRSGLPADSPVNADRLKPDRLVQADAGLVGKRDPGARHLHSLAPQQFQKGAVERTAETMSLMAPVHVDGNVRRPAIRGPRPMRAGIRVPGDRSTGLGHQPRIPG
jgi:2-methylcitrate dehydratase PrpD